MMSLLTTYTYAHLSPISLDKIIGKRIINAEGCTNVIVVELEDGQIVCFESEVFLGVTLNEVIPHENDLKSKLAKRGLGK